MYKTAWNWEKRLCSKNNIKYAGFIILIIVFNLSAYAQEVQIPAKEIGVSFFTLEMNSETVNPRPEPKFVYGLFFNQNYSNISWISSAGFGKNVIKDDCPYCMDSFYGKGKMTEFITSTGIKSNFLKERSIKFKPFLESDLFYTYIRYSGDFQGGLTGHGKQVDHSSNTFGILGRTGLSFYPVPEISLTVSSSLRFGYGMLRDHYDNSIDNTGSFAATFLHIRLGYLF
jgi:hypothetical protein